MKEDKINSKSSKTETGIKWFFGAFIGICGAIPILMCSFPEFREYIKNNNAIVAVAISLMGLGATLYLNYKLIEHARKTDSRADYQVVKQMQIDMYDVRLDIINKTRRWYDDLGGFYKYNALIIAGSKTMSDFRKVLIEFDGKESQMFALEDAFISAEFIFPNSTYLKVRELHNKLCRINDKRRGIENSHYTLYNDARDGDAIIKELPKETREFMIIIKEYLELSPSIILTMKEETKIYKEPKLIDNNVSEEGIPS